MTPPPISPLAVTMGEPAGIGGEITLKAWQALRHDGPPFFVIDWPERLEGMARGNGPAVPVRAIASPQEAAATFATALPVLPLSAAPVARPGHVQGHDAPLILESIDRAVALACAGQAGAVVTNPIAKKSLYDRGFSHPGHTEYLSHLDGGRMAVMMLSCPKLKVVPATIHIPLANVTEQLSRPLLENIFAILHRDLRQRFAIPTPRIATAGLNPHAGEGGAIGREESAIITPAINAARAAGIDVTGPWPADTLFHEEARQRYDAAVCMYHDQALIPVKTLDFHHGVNVTLGLSFIRTSPDHGTALDLAGTGRARADSLIAAILTAAEMARNADRHRHD